MSVSFLLRRLILAVGSRLLGLWVRLWAKSCHVQVHDDPRPELRKSKQPYVYALLHEHLVAALLANDEPQLCAMVSRSQDGDFLVPSLRARNVTPVRGSGGRRALGKGGETALRQLMRQSSLGVPVLLAVDGPRGPRGTVHGGVVALARATGAILLPIAVVAQRAFVLQKTWDKTQLPMLGTCLHLHFATPIVVDKKAVAAHVVQQVRQALQELRKGCPDGCA